MKLNLPVQSESTKRSVPPEEGDRIFLQSTHLSAFLATCECKPTSVSYGPEVTALGNKVAKWSFLTSPTVIEIAKMWRNPVKDARDWSQLNKEEKEIVINFMSAFSDNLKHFLSDAKRESR